MNENLETLNANLGALSDLVKTSRFPQQKRRGKDVGVPSDDDGTDIDADDEESEVRRYQTPKRKTKKDNDLRVRQFFVEETLLTVVTSQGLIRAHTRSLLKLEATDSLRCDVTKEEAEGYDITKGHPCTKETFRLYLDGTPGHKWNQSAGVVFTKSFLERRPDFKYEQVKKCFAVHLRTLVATYRKHKKLQEAGENEKAAAAALSRRETRKQAVGHTTPGVRPSPLTSSAALPPSH